MEQTEHPKLLGIRLSALVEMALFFAIMLVLDLVLGSGDRFYHVSPHPFWIIVLLVACQYGTVEGLATALAATFILLFGNMPEQSIQQDMYSYLFSVALTPLLWLIAAVSLGELRLRHVRERTRLQQELASAQEREDKITQSYQWVRDLKEKLELRIAGQLRSSVTTYQAARQMESLSPQDVIGGLQELVSAVLNPDKFSIYTLDANGLTTVLTQGWRDTDTYARNFPARSEFYRAVIGSRQLLCAVNTEHEQLLAGQGVLAGPLVDRASGEVMGVLKIEKLGFTDLNLSSIETFGAICEWAGMAMANARKYQLAKSDSIVSPDNNLHTASYFRRHSEYITALGKRVGFNVTMVLVKLANGDAMTEENRVRVARMLSESVQKVLRQVDLAFDYQGTSEEYSIILPATDRKGAEIVLDKIRRELGQRAGSTVRNADFVYSVQPLFER
jgi:hypothetical protein